MTESELVKMLQNAASMPAPTSSVGSAVMNRVRMDTGRAHRWRVLAVLMVLAALVGGLMAAIAVGWGRAAQDTTHNTPPSMSLFQEGVKP